GSLEAMREGEHLGDPSRATHGLWRRLGWLVRKAVELASAPTKELAGEHQRAVVLLLISRGLDLRRGFVGHGLASMVAPGRALFAGPRCSAPTSSPAPRSFNITVTW